MSQSSPENIREAAAAIAEQCLAMRVRRLNRSLTSIYDDAFRPLGITAGQVNMLVAVIKRGELSPGQLGGILKIEKSTLSRNLERMRKAGWIEITAPATGRTHAIHATRKGGRLLLQALPLWRDAQLAATRLLGPRGSRALREIGDHTSGGNQVD